MAAVETGQAIITALYTRLTGDTTLKSVLGATFGCYRVMAPVDPDLPYFVHRLDMRGDLLHGTHTYLLDLWYYGADSATVDSAIDRIKILLHAWRFKTASDEAQGVLEWFSGGYIPTDAADVWHYATQWVIRYEAARDITNIVVG